MFYMFGMLKFQVPNAEVIFLVKFFYDIPYLSLIFEMCASKPLAWAHNIRYVMLCYVIANLSAYDALINGHFDNNDLPRW